MGIKQKLKNIPAVYNLLLTTLNAINYFNIRFKLQYPSYQLSERWQHRIALVKQSADNDYIKPVSGAGKLFNNYQLMHNGMKITLGSYYDYGNTRLLEENNGVHEPQEEFVFQEVLKEIQDNGSMMELGSYWAFYSIWFASKVPGAKCYMVEPDPHKMNSGKLNFKLNRLSGTFISGFIDQYDQANKSIPTYSVDSLMTRYKIGFLDILHSDIQGYELNMLRGAEKSLLSGNIGYLFISTHSNELHYQCRDFLLARNYDIVCSADLNETYSWDGVLVAKSKKLTGIKSIAISKRTGA
jgi:hypothetical protein